MTDKHVCDSSPISEISKDLMKEATIEKTGEKRVMKNLGG